MVCELYIRSNTSAESLRIYRIFSLQIRLDGIRNQARLCLAACRTERWCESSSRRELWGREPRIYPFEPGLISYRTVIESTNHPQGKWSSKLYAEFGVGRSVRDRLSESCAGPCCSRAKTASIMGWETEHEESTEEATGPQSSFRPCHLRRTGQTAHYRCGIPRTPRQGAPGSFCDLSRWSHHQYVGALGSLWARIESHSASAFLEVKTMI